MQFKSHIKEIKRLENARRSITAVAACAIGLIGTVLPDVSELQLSGQQPAGLNGTRITETRNICKKKQKGGTPIVPIVIAAVAAVVTVVIIGVLIDKKSITDNSSKQQKKIL